MLKFKCRVCGNVDCETIIDLGDQYLSDFRTDDLKPNKYPLELLRCPECHFVQLRETAPLSEMYTENYGFKSGVNNTIKADLKDIVNQAQTYLVEPTRIDYGDSLQERSVLDIGSNDGTLLSNYPSYFYKVGFDPIGKLCAEAKQHAQLIINDFFSLRAAKQLKQFDVITAISMFYDVENPGELIEAMKLLLKKDGVLIIQQNYILATLVNNAYDNVCHEHIGYHSLLSMEYLLNKHGLEVVDVSTSMVNGGVLRTVIQHKGVSKPKLSVAHQRFIEQDYGLHTPFPYQGFAKRVEEGAKQLKRVIADINESGKKCYIYGASTRGGTIWQYVGLDVSDLPFAVDRNPDKVGKKIASIGVPIISEKQAREDMPEYMLVSIWFFKDEVVEREQSYIKRGGTLIFPLPELESICR